ncbi:hypothetical protein DERP_002166 [Dermatophagoides pteronyssinus]|uniref:Uncharacterized protein n=2 Tax=Dermatophagoides pteronyssinus TaxID=6956 RepID=A0ABQ8JGY5_DERPT|nr:uncharacterized protein LOC113791950 [Dermatophagoides pteronyssinus]KAH9421876.1 hypothetical protein DERP_002166 [Dermatophagoides pteronyssinus]
MSSLKLLCQRSSIFHNQIIVPLIFNQDKRLISVQEWRKKYNRPKNRLDFMPEWSYLDGRGYGPPSAVQKKRYIRDQVLGQTVVERLIELQEAKKF